MLILLVAENEQHGVNSRLPIGGCLSWNSRRADARPASLKVTQSRHCHLNAGSKNTAVCSDAYDTGTVYNLVGDGAVIENLIGGNRCNGF
jgi:hypothetical protein